MRPEVPDIPVPGPEGSGCRPPPGPPANTAPPLAAAGASSRGLRRPALHTCAPFRGVTVPSRLGSDPRPLLVSRARRAWRPIPQQQLGCCTASQRSAWATLSACAALRGGCPPLFRPGTQSVLSGRRDEFCFFRQTRTLARVSLSMLHRSARMNFQGPLVSFSPFWKFT